MGKNVEHIQHIKSNVVLEGKPKLPQPGVLVEGELAINYAKGLETISIENTSGEVVTFSSDNYYTEQKLGSGFTSENSAVTVTDVIEENEEIISAALNDLDERKLDASAYTPSVELWEAGSGNNSAVLKNSSGTASGNYSVAEGNSTSATSDSSHAEGSYTLASGIRAHAEGSETIASGYYSHSEGGRTSATSFYAHAEGGSTIASKDNAHAEGFATVANGNASHAEGMNTYASGGFGSHSEGFKTSATTFSSHAEGESTLASGTDTHAEGYKTVASGHYSHAEGYDTLASGYYSHAEGNGTIANNDSEHASGQYNVSSTASTDFGDSGNTLFSVGNGTAEDARHNAFEIRQNGDIYITSGNSDIKLQDHLGGGTVDQVIDSGTSASTNAVATKAVYDAIVDTELVWTNAYVAMSGEVSAHTANTEIHVTAADKEKLHTHSNKSALDSITGNVGTMAYQTANSYSSATEVNTALGNKAETTALTQVNNTLTAHTADTTVHFTTGTVQTQIDNSISGKVNTSDIVSAITPSNSGSTAPIATKVVAENELTVSNALNDLNAAITPLAAHTADTSIHITSGDRTKLDSMGTMAYEDVNSYSSATQVSNALGAKVNSATFTAHTADSTVHLTSTEKTNIDALETNIAAISGITSTKVGNWDTAYTNNHTHSNKTYLDGITGAVGTMAYQNASSYSSATQVNTALSGKANTATTIAGYGITDAKIANQVITLGSNSITVSSSTQVNTALSGKSDTGHTHDDRYYTETEINNKIAAMSGSSTGATNKTITAMSETNGVVTPTYANISITKSQVSDFPTSMTPTAHNQASNTITAMTSYAKASSASAIATGDTLNTAIGKLEKALDGKQASGNYASGSSFTTNNIIVGGGGTKINASTVQIETSLSSTLDTKVPTSKAIATYVTSQMTSVLTYKGSISANATLQNAHKVGDVYVVSSAGTYAGKACEVGDYLIANTARESASTVTNSDWDAINGENQVENKSASLAAAGSSATLATVDGTNITVTTPSTWTGVAKTGTVTKVSTASGLTGGDITTSGTIGLAATGTSGTYGPAANVTGTNNTTIKVPQITTDAYGRVTSVAERTYTSVDHTYTVNNGTFAVSGNGVSVASTSANASANSGVNIKAGTNISITTATSEITISATDTTYTAGTASQISAGTSTYNGLWSAKNLKDGIAALGYTKNTGTVTKVSTASGITGGDITTSGTIGLAATGTAGTYYRVVTDAYGRVTSGNTTNPNTDVSVAQAPTSDNNNYEVLFSKSANNTAETGTTRKDSKLIYNPSVGRLSTTSLNQLITGSGTAASTGTSGTSTVYYPAKWTYNKSIAPSDGDIYTIKIPVAGHDYGTFISLNNGTNYYPLAGVGNGRIGGQYGVNNYVSIIYESGGTVNSVFPLTGGTSRVNITSGGAFRVINYYDSNTTDICNTYMYCGYYYPAQAINRYMVCFRKSENKLIPASTTNNSTANTKTINTDTFDPFGGIYYFSSAGTVATTSVVPNGTLHDGFALDLRYSFNVANVLTANKEVYVVAEPQTDGSAKFRSPTTSGVTAGPISQTLPTTDDGKIYIYLGVAYNTYSVVLSRTHPVYQFKNGQLRQYVGSFGNAAYLNTGTTSGTVAAGNHNHSGTYATNAFSRIAVNATNVDADSTGDTFTITAGTFVSLTGDATNDKMTIGVSTGTTSSTLARGDHQSHYWANLQTSSAANYITEPEIKSVKINGSSTNAASTNNCHIQYDTTNKCLKFLFN